MWERGSVQTACHLICVLFKPPRLCRDLGVTGTVVCVCGSWQSSQAAFPLHKRQTDALANSPQDVLQHCELMCAKLSGGREKML